MMPVRANVTWHQHHWCARARGIQHPQVSRRQLKQMRVWCGQGEDPLCTIWQAREEMHSGSHKTVQQWLFEYLLPQWSQRHGTCLGHNTLGSCSQCTHHYRSPVRMVPQTALYWEQGPWAYVENLAHHPHPPLLLLLQHSLMETIKTLRLFMFIVFICRISVQRSNARQHWAAAAIWSMAVHPQTHVQSCITCNLLYINQHLLPV